MTFEPKLSSFVKEICRITQYLFPIVSKKHYRLQQSEKLITVHLKKKQRIYKERNDMPTG